MNEKCAVAPAQQLNDIASQIIDVLSTTIPVANIINDRLYGCDNAKTSPCDPEPDNLDSRLRLIRTMVQDLQVKLSNIRDRV